MEKEFWRKKWEARDLGFHQERPNPSLVRHIGELGLPKPGRVFVPLCGKTLDIAWLRSKGYLVAGCEIIVTAVEEFFRELDVIPRIEKIGDIHRYHHDGIDLFVGDIFRLTQETLGAVDGVYDRAALVALPKPMRHRYTAHLQEITRGAPQILICYEYDQTRVDGPPFSISPDEVREHYGAERAVLLESSDVPGGMKGKCPARESIWKVKRV